MTTRLIAVALVLSWPASVGAQDAPLADHHQHLFSPALAAAMSPPAPAPQSRPVTATDLIALLDAAGIRRAVVLSTGYIFEQPSRKIESAGSKLQADHDWTSQQVAQYPGRLIGFCGLNPLKDYALDELARCARNPNLRNGLKLHFGNSVVDYHDPQHIEQVKRVFRAANGYRMPIVVHMRASFGAKLPYGRDAHLAAAGAPSDPGADQALEVFIEAIGRGDAHASRLYFDAPSVIPTATLSTDAAAAIAARIRGLGVQRVLFGSDATGGALTPRVTWDAFRKLPLTEAEFRTIAANVAPYLR
jgi:predicted TIM-barrel fold metal-dependent hydrolase